MAEPKKKKGKLTPADLASYGILPGQPEGPELPKGQGSEALDTALVVEKDPPVCGDERENPSLQDTQRAADGKPQRQTSRSRKRPTYSTAGSLVADSRQCKTKNSAKLVVQDDTKQRAMDLQPAVVVNKA